MDSETDQPATQGEKLALWSMVLLLCVVSGMVYSTHAGDSDRLAALRASEAQKEQSLAAVERARLQTDRYINRFSTDQEFVRDQARERLGVAAPGEIVIRLEGGALRPVQPAR
ncbi:MAG: FtsB family cell division protein [Opitutales bacterium]